MFRKRKDSGAIQVLDEEGDVPRYDDLGLDRERDEAAAPVEDLDNMTSEQLQKLTIASAKTGKESTARALRIANEAHEIGTTTAATMQQQTEQLEKMSEEIEVVHDYLDKSERTLSLALLPPLLHSISICHPALLWHSQLLTFFLFSFVCLGTLEKMNKSKLVRMFQWKKPTGKGLNNVKGSRKEKEQREELRQKGLEAIDIKSLKTEDGTVPMRDLQREQLLETDDTSTTARRNWLGKKREEEQRTETKDIRENYSQYTPEVADVLKDQDNDLDQISQVVSDMKAMGAAMNNELDYQNRVVNEVQDFSMETARRTKQNARNIAKIK